MSHEYPVIIKYDTQDGVYYVDFPDVDGCFTDGENLHEALNNAEDALNTMLSYYENNSYVIPQPSNIKDIHLGMGEIVAIIKANTELKIAV